MKDLTEPEKTFNYRTGKWEEFSDTRMADYLPQSAWARDCYQEYLDEYKCTPREAFILTLRQYILKEQKDELK